MNETEREPADELTHEEHVEEATTCVQRMHKARNFLHFAAGNAHTIGEHELAAELDGIRDDIDALREEWFEEAEEE